MSVTDQDALLNGLLRRTGPLNLERAWEVMAEHELEGLVVGDPLNVFHALGYWPQIANTRAGQPPSSFALLSRRPDRAPGFVTTRFIYYYTWADGQFDRELETWLYEDAGDSGDAPPAAEFSLIQDAGLAPLTSVEQRRQAALTRLSPERRTVRDAGAALVQAMQALGLWQGRIAFDHPVIAAVCERHGHPGTLVAADNILRAIRLVKSPLEIQLMRRAAAANVGAVHAVIEQLRAGASYGDLRRVFEVEAAQRGNRAVFLTVDRVSSELSDERVREGQTLFIDGVSHFHHYHGDYARTVFVGEPAGPARQAAAAMRHGWQAVREQLRPGLRYSDIARIGREAVRKGGFDVAIGFGPHSVGLAHTDEPCDDAGGFYRKADLVLRENMVLSVDCPVMAAGIGGSAHMEDLMLITANGAEPLHELSDAVVQT
jgi:Xaa-Pro aminopeptidase